MTHTNGKTLLITGGAGFIAHHVISFFLKNTDYDIISLDRLDFSGNLNRVNQMMEEFDSDTRKRLKVVYHDLRAEFNDQTKELLGDVNVILHMAAASHVTRSIKYPLEFIQNNIIGTAHLLEYARTLKNLNRMIYFSTDEVFGPAIPNVRFTEYDRYNSTSPYSASKAAAEELCVAYSNTYNIPIYITHTMNVFGERQAIEKYIPMTIEKVKNDETITIHINKKTNTIGSRCYLHALDVGDALLFILNLKEITLPIDHKGGKCPKFNIASIEELNNLEVAKIIAEAQNKELKYDLIEPLDRPGHDFRYSISGDYLRSLGWQPKISVKERLTEVVKWTIGQEKF